MEADSRVLILMGSESDLPVMREASESLASFGIASDLRIASAHRTPDRALQLAREARDAGYFAIVAGAGMAAHLPGVVAAVTTLPVIGVPLASGALGGTDSLYSVVQMPRGVPVATVAIDGAYNAGVLAAQILGVSDAGVADRVAQHKRHLADKVTRRDEALQRECQPDLQEARP